MNSSDIKQSERLEFERDGFLLINNVLTRQQVASLRKELVSAIEQDLEIRPDIFDSGMVHNCMFRGVEMAKLLNHPVLNQYSKALLAEHCIVYAYQSSSLLPQSSNYGSRVHVDCPRHIPSYITNLGVIFPLDDFTVENGATLCLPGSHTEQRLPDDEDFYANAIRITASQGDMIIFHARLAHAAGNNQTDKVRHALTINMCRPFMRQRFDFPRMASDKVLQLLDANGKELLGMNVRMPTNLDEFYLPPSERLYKPGQE